MRPLARTGVGTALTPKQISALYLWFGAIGVFGNVMVSRHTSRPGAARAVGLAWMTAAIAVSLWAQRHMRHHKPLGPVHA